jgi:type III secretion protein J
VKYLTAGLICLMLLLSGCSDDTDLFTGMSEQDSNDVIASLADQHIDARKRSEKTGVVISVPCGSSMRPACRVVRAPVWVKSSRKKG